MLSRAILNRTPAACRRLLSAASSTQAAKRLTLYTGTDCQLCEVMRAEIDKVAQKIPISLSTYNIRDDSLPDVQHWRRLYQYDIPVLHLDGQEIFRHRVTAEALLSRLESQDAGSV